MEFVSKGTKDSMEQQPLEELRQFLMRLPAGPISSGEQPKLVQLLQGCWHMFSGSDEEKMEAWKLERMKEPVWNPPCYLAFEIVRHGGMALGSTRAERQIWYVDLNKRQADCQVVGYYQVYPRAPAFKVDQIADELVKLITSGSSDERLQWAKNGHVRVNSGKILPADSPKGTLYGRRKRLVKAMEKRLAPQGWHLKGSWWSKKS